MVNILNKCLCILVVCSQLSKTYYNVLFGSFTRDRHARRIYLRTFATHIYYISADVQRIILNALCMTISGERTEQLDIFCRVTGFTSDFLSFIVVELAQFFHGALQLCATYVHSFSDIFPLDYLNNSQILLLLVSSRTFWTVCSKGSFFNQYGDWSTGLCGRPPQYAPVPCKLTFDLLPWKWCPSHVWRGLPLCQFWYS